MQVEIVRATVEKKLQVSRGRESGMKSGGTGRRIYRFSNYEIEEMQVEFGSIIVRVIKEKWK